MTSECRTLLFVLAVAMSSLTGAHAQPNIFQAGVVNAASGEYVAAFSPGTLISIYGTNLGPAVPMSLTLDDAGLVTTTLGSVKVHFIDSTTGQDILGPLLYVSNTQVNLIVPFAVCSGATDPVFWSRGGTLQLEYNGFRSNGIDRPCYPSESGIFTIDGSGFGQGAILNQDYSVNGPTNPAKRGSVVMIYATGGGQLDPPVTIDGQIADLDLRRVSYETKVEIGGMWARVYYAGSAPGMVFGVIQVNAQVPEDLTVSGAVIRVGVGLEFNRIDFSPYVDLYIQ